MSDDPRMGDATRDAQAGAESLNALSLDAKYAAPLNSIPVFGQIAYAASLILAAIGGAIGGAVEDTFHIDSKQAEAWLTIFRIAPETLFQGVDNTGAPLQAQKLVRYFRIISGEVPTGKYGNTGELYNPNNNDCKNPYMCAPPDPDEPLTDNAIVTRLHDAFGKWVADGSKIGTLVKSVPSQNQHPTDSKQLLDLIRATPGPFMDLMKWDTAVKNKTQIAEQIRAARVRAGEHGPDKYLSAIFGDVSVTPTTKDPKMTGGFSQGLGLGIGLLPGLLIGGSLLSLAAYYWPKRRP